MKLKVEFINQTSFKIDGSALGKHLTEIAGRLSVPKQLDTLEVELVAMPAEKVRELNNKYRQMDQETDVLSFPGDRAQSASLLGSVVLNPQLAASYAKQSATNMLTELKMLSGHGLLHLLGFEHR